MILEHEGKRPHVHASAYVAPNATLCGDVTIGENSRVLFGAIVTAEGGAAEVGSNCAIMENAVVRGTARHPVRIGNNVLVGPRAYLTGCTVEDNVFLATGATVFNGALIGRGAEVRVNGVVHLETVLPVGAVVPIGWVAVGDPAEVLPSEDHEKIWSIQGPLNFPRTIFGVDRADPATMMPEIMHRYTRALKRHQEDKTLES